MGKKVTKTEYFAGVPYVDQQVGHCWYQIGYWRQAGKPNKYCTLYVNDAEDSTKPPSIDRLDMPNWFILA